MKRFLFSIAICIFLLSPAYANHITGGEMFYTLVSFSGNDYTYHVTLKLYRDCNSTGAQLDAAAPIAIFNRTTGGSVWSNSVHQSKIVVLNLRCPSPCITN